VVEFHPDGSIFPVEYKHGKRRRWLNDDLQLAAQALCLEEMLQRPIPRAAIFHQQSRRRREVEIDEALRNTVTQTATDMHTLLTSKRIPPPTTQTQRCRECSLLGICSPELSRAGERLANISATLYDPENTP
jgi:CRISPR-associated exonuclease Cas4